MSEETAIPAAVFFTDEGSWLIFNRPCAVITSNSIDTVLPCLEEIERYVKKGFYAAGYIAYEAAGAFDRSLAVFNHADVPLLSFAVFERPYTSKGLSYRKVNETALQWEPSINYGEYRSAVDRIKGYIAAGDTYQVNYTFRLCASFDIDPWDFFCTVAAAHPMPFAAFIDAGRYKICSFSPELFFRLHGDRIVMQPMKGTAPRGRFNAEDLLIGQELQMNGKERAENVMIVDMIRNDLGRIASVGTVSVTELCVVRRFPSILQMISTIEADTTAGFSEIVAALFPCASITGAPKIRTSEIIRELEKSPRNVYCGTIGWLGPERIARFSVAIRTVLIDSLEKRAEFGTGSGIVWDSDVDREYRECRLKAAFVKESPPDFRLVETMLWTSDEGFFLLERHFKRLMDSAEYFSFEIDRERVERRLYEAVASFNHRYMRVRLRVDRKGEIIVETSALENKEIDSNAVVELHFSGRVVDTADCFLFHKTDRRKQYDSLRKEFPQGDDLLLWNRNGEVTETLIGNIVAKIDGVLYTPPIECGLLAGVFREELLERGAIRQRKIYIEELFSAESLFRINSVRKWQPCSISKTSRPALRKLFVTS